MKKLTLIFSSLLVGGLLSAQANVSCIGASPFCSENTYSFPMNVDAADAQVGPDYGCLFSQPNPAWYYMQIDQSGDLTIYMESMQGEDVDFICYGPFNNLAGACDNLTAGNTVDCSFSAAASETCVIPGAVVGEYYLLLLTNYSNNTSTVTFNQTNVGAPGAGSSDCDIINPGAGNNGPICAGEVLELYADDIDGASYSWVGPNGFTSNVEDPIITNTSPASSGIYTCYITGLNFSDTVTTNVVVNPQPGGQIIYNAGCEGQIVNFSVTGAAAPIVTYAWSFGVPGATSTAATPGYTYPASGDYTVTVIVTTAAGCVDTLTRPIHIGVIPVPDFTAAPLEGCYPFPVSFTNLSTISSGTIQSYQWNFGNNVTSSNADPVYTYPNVSNTYNVSLTVTSAEGCDSTLTRPAYIRVHGQPIADFIFTPTYPDEIFNVVTFNNLTINGENFFWDFGDGTNSTAHSPSHQYASEEGTYIVTLIVANAFGCNDTTQLTVYVKPTFTIYIPNSFTPNGDGHNEFFKIYGHHLKDARMEIFNRWGQNVFTQTGNAPFITGWNGNRMSTTDPVKQDVYTYKIIITDIFNKTHEFTGQVNLIR